MDFLSIINQLFSFSAVAGQALLIFFVVLLVLKRKNELAFFSRNALLFSFLLSFGGILGSLLYSEVIGYEACELCWYQRIFLYPQAILFFTALLKKDSGIFQYTIPLSIVGAVVAGYQYLLQMGFMPSLLCTADYTVSCAQRFFMYFGYVTIPFMSLILFLLLIALGVIRKKVV
ncbi:MAG: disulfide bond formation protein B [Candidatus Wildermuthbacteria bacterium]|nr:disulfide bond formation protein B [Candidatus Wildermuthbacteria bacterium]